MPSTHPQRTFAGEKDTVKFSTADNRKCTLPVLSAKIWRQFVAKMLQRNQKIAVILSNYAVLLTLVTKYIKDKRASSKKKKI
jgi:uncharacterized protein VirK/YbjX